MTAAKSSPDDAASVHFSVISAASRPLTTLQKLRDQFKAQTFTDFEHVIIYDGPPPSEVKEFFESEMLADPRCRFESLAVKDGRFGTAPRNRGIEIARGAWIVFADDDDLYHPDYLRAFHDLKLSGDMLGVVRMNNYGTVVPRHPIKDFPRECHVGTPSCCYPAIWFRENSDLRWDDDGTYSHDYALVRKCIDKSRPQIRINPRVVVKAANEKILDSKGFPESRKMSYLSWHQPNKWLTRFNPAENDRWLSRKLFELGLLFER